MKEEAMKEEGYLDDHYPQWLFEVGDRTLDGILIDWAEEMRAEMDSKPSSAKLV